MRPPAHPLPPRMQNFRGPPLFTGRFPAGIALGKNISLALAVRAAIGQDEGMRFAYADPPYPGQSKRLYGDHPDYAGEVDHAELISRLVTDYPDGWALSTSATELRSILILCPADVQVAIWHVTNAEHPGGRKCHWWRVWEPVIVHGGRTDAPLIRNLTTAGRPRAGFTGAKPATFSRWVFGLLGALPGDELDDLFPGSGAVGRAWEEYRSQPWLPELEPRRKEDRRDMLRREAREARKGSALLLS